MHFPTFREFYQKPLKPLGPDDAAQLKTESFLESGFTHILIALEGHPASPGSEVYSWQVKIFQADKEGSFLWEKALFVSEEFQSFDAACQFAGELDRLASNDKLSTFFNNKKIN